MDILSGDNILVNLWISSEVSGEPSVNFDFSVNLCQKISDFQSWLMVTNISKLFNSVLVNK
jgi:hypothetical protein